jgi:hypothetical protein
MDLKRESAVSFSLCCDFTLSAASRFRQKTLHFFDSFNTLLSIYNVLQEDDLTRFAEPFSLAVWPFPFNLDAIIHYAA